MSILEAIVLGVIQGLTEFLPVSSSGHLVLANSVLDNDLDPDKSMLMTVVLHFATACSTVVIFRKELLIIFKGLFQFKWNDEAKFSVKIILSMIPAVLVGLFLEDQIESFFNGNVLLVGCMLLVTGLLLFLADKAKNTEKQVGFSAALIIGLSQAIAILPGISRSGATISTAVLLGIDRDKSARFSFLMVVPLIFGLMAKDMMSDKIAFDTADFAPLAVGFIVAFVTGLLACNWMIALVKKAQLKYFSFYCFLVGIGAMVYAVING
ncbi:undecaprenyl-diphosphate phosphatase [Paracrocinitomix mangrovi]|uniref:undecaprenyl-diphosphate phosphatase n=1 Tax=Paracrocinitomix mangrovi TaxID=2862509 RepID=UPI001C8F188F|nr:undecaprenyl-diphosphate phosphatase [Paracrocinitomix mangrovi]UKN00904.1 undecaprenyl-diphosphate phosphatase [Paracrocinitomix mangrovi]